MTLYEFSHDVIPIIQASISFLGLLSLVMVFWQIRQTRIWNRLHSTHNFLNVELARELEKDVITQCDALSIKISDGLKPEDVPKLLTSPSAILAAKAFLNDCENLCAAYRIGYIDRDCAYSIHSARIVRSHKIFLPFVAHLRQKHQDDEIYLELEKTALEWEATGLNQRKKRESALQKLQARLDNAKGLQPKA